MSELAKASARTRAAKQAEEASEKARVEHGNNVQVLNACTVAARCGDISYNMRAHVVGCLIGDGSPEAIKEWMPSGGGVVKTDGNPHTAKEADLFPQPSWKETF